MSDDLSRHPHRRLSPLTPVVRAPLLLLAVIGGSWQQIVNGGDWGLAGAALIGLLIAGALYGVASWVRTSSASGT